MTRILPALIPAFSISYLWHSSPEHSAMWRFQRWCNPHSCGKKMTTAWSRLKIKKEINLVCAFNALKAITWANLTTEGLHHDILTLRTSKGSSFTLWTACFTCFVCHSAMWYILYSALMQIQTKASVSSLALTWRPKDLHKIPLEVNRPWQPHKYRTKS